MEHRCPSQHLTPPKTPLGMNTHFFFKCNNSDWHMKSYIHKIFVHLHPSVGAALTAALPPGASLSESRLNSHVFYLSLSSGFRSSLGEYHKDSRNLRRHKDPSELTSELLACHNIWTVKTEYLWVYSWRFPLWILPPLALRFRLLKHTRLNVVAFLNELPKTQHDIASFNVDVNTYTVSS